MAKIARNISQMRNLGPATERMLRDVGVNSADELRAIGAVDAFLRLQFAQSGVSLNALYAMEAALLDIDWRELLRERKSGLKRAVGR